MELQPISKDVRQGCILPLDMLSLYRDDNYEKQNMRELRIGGSNINNLRYAGDTVLLADTR